MKTIQSFLAIPKRGKAVMTIFLFKVIINIILCISYCHSLNTAEKIFKVILETDVLW